MSAPRRLGRHVELRDPRLAPTMIARVLRTLRLNRGWTQYSLADALFVRQSMVSELERGGIDMRLSTLVRWAEAVGARVVIELPAHDAPRPAGLRGVDMKDHM